MDYNKRYDEWMSHLSEEDPLKAELYKIKDNEKEKEERFYQDLSFGTAGLRGKVGAGTNMMNFLTVGKASQGIADYISETKDCSFPAEEHTYAIEDDVIEQLMREEK